MLAVVGIVTFFGFLRLPMGGAPGFSDGKMRSALTGALVMTYLVYFSSTIWTAGHPSQADRANELLETLTGLLAIVLPFYFGVTGAVEIAKGRSAPSKDETADQAANGV